jgi:predicted Zn-dependent protease
MIAMNKDPKVLDKVVDELSRKILEEGFDQNLEFESDRIGFHYAFRVGYNPIGLQQVLNGLSQTDQAKRRNLSSTHPNLKHRMQQLSR